MASSKNKVLVVDDDLRLRDLLQRYLTEQGFAVATVSDAPGMDKALARERHDLLVLDLMLPGEDGLTLARKLKARSQQPIIMLSARGEDVDRIVGLEVGADDYLAKPFNPRELVARLRAILRRTSGAASAGPAQPVHLADVELHPESRSVTCDGKPVGLTGAEFDLLSAFLRSPGKIISREDLTQAALGRPMSPMDRSIDVHVSNLRRKLGPYDGEQERIKAIRGSGYVYLLPGEQPA